MATILEGVDMSGALVHCFRHKTQEPLSEQHTVRRSRQRRSKGCDAGLWDSGLERSDRGQLVTDPEAEEAQMERHLQRASGKLKLASPQLDYRTSINLPKGGQYHMFVCSTGHKITCHNM